MATAKLEMDRGSPSEYTTEDGRPNRPEGEHANRSRDLAASIYDAQVRGAISRYDAGVLTGGLRSCSIELDKAKEKLRILESESDSMADYVQSKLRRKHREASRRAVHVTIFVDDMDKYRELQDRFVALGYSNCSIEPWDKDESKSQIYPYKTPGWIAEELSDLLWEFIPMSSVDIGGYGIARQEDEAEVDIYPQQILTKTDNEDETSGFEGLGSLFG